MMDLNHPRSEIIFKAAACLDVIIACNRDNGNPQVAAGSDDIVLQAINELRQLAHTAYSEHINAIETQLSVIEQCWLKKQKGNPAIFAAIKKLDRELGTWAI